MPRARDLVTPCPRCNKAEAGETASTTDGSTLICDSCAKSEKVYKMIKDRANQLTIDSWAYDQSKWPVKTTKALWRSIDFKDFE